MGDALLWHRLQFAFTAVYHYLFPQLTVGLAPVIVFLRWRALRDPQRDDAALADFFAKIFALNFAFGVFGIASSVFPVMLRALDGRSSVTAQQAAAASHALHVGVGWYAVGIGLAAGYFVNLFRIHAGARAAPSRRSGSR